VKGRPYLDTGLVLKLVVPEPLSPRVTEWLARRKAAVPYPRLVDVEIENTLQAKRFRQEISTQQLQGARGLVRELLREGKFFRPDLSMEKVMLEALEAIPQTTGATGCRTLDLLHVISGKMLNCSEFLTADKRQAQAARVYGLKVEFMQGGTP